MVGALGASTHDVQPYTEYISTRWYRAPECLLTDGYYGPEMDQWGAGCVFFEITSLYPLFPGTNELDQIGRVHKVKRDTYNQAQAFDTTYHAFIEVYFFVSFFFCMRIVYAFRRG